MYKYVKSSYMPDPPKPFPFDSPEYADKLQECADKMQSKYSDAEVVAIAPLVFVVHTDDNPNYLFYIDEYVLDDWGDFRMYYADSKTVIDDYLRKGGDHSLISKTSSRGTVYEPYRKSGRSRVKVTRSDGYEMDMTIKQAETAYSQGL